MLCCAVLMFENVLPDLRHQMAPERVKPWVKRLDPPTFSSSSICGLQSGALVRHWAVCIGMNGRPFSSLWSILYYVHDLDPGLTKSTPLRPGRDFTSYVTRYGCACVRIAVTRDGCACEKGFGFSVYGLVITVLMIFLMEKWSFISIIFVQWTHKPVC